MTNVDLARKYEPVLLFGKDSHGRDENFFPMSVTDYVSACRLYRRGQGAVQVPPPGLSLELLAGPYSSADYYLALCADKVLSRHPSFAERWRNGGVALYSLNGGPVEAHLKVPAGPSASFAAGDPNLQRVQLGRAPQTPAGVSFALPGGGPSAETPLEDYLVRDWANLPKEVAIKAIESYKPFTDFDRHPPVYNFRVHESDGFTVIQYWFFYAFNDWGSQHDGVNDHEADWESIFVFLKNGEPSHVAYSAHNGPPERHAWNDTTWEKSDGHPVVYVGCGSHAAYFMKGNKSFHLWTDFAQGNGKRIGPGAGSAAAWGNPVDLDQQPWNTGFKGGWGALVKKWWSTTLSAGIDAPHGPADHAEQWSSPVRWAQIPA